ncbi:MAG TPA: hypothetical protein VFN91_09485 [Myxococcaceae bacterium]|nr:hypothetical protein [Myxococcaceae bacterium]
MRAALTRVEASAGGSPRLRRSAAPPRARRGSTGFCTTARTSGNRSAKRRHWTDAAHHDFPGDLLAVLVELGEELVPVESGKDQGEDDDVVAQPPGDDVQRAPAVLRRNAGISVILEQLAEQLPLTRVALNTRTVAEFRQHLSQPPGESEVFPGPGGSFMTRSKRAV